jgi:hypothetical protein
MTGYSITLIFQESRPCHRLRPGSSPNHRAVSQSFPCRNSAGSDPGGAPLLPRPECLR